MFKKTWQNVTMHHKKSPSRGETINFLLCSIILVGGAEVGILQPNSSPELTIVRYEPELGKLG